MNVRLLASRLAVTAVVGVALVTQHAWKEEGTVDTALAAVGFVLLVVGSVGRIWCAAYICGRKGIELVTEGPFSITRNPLYLFSLIALVGVGLAFESLTLSAALACVFFLTHWHTMTLEERFLLRTFGEPYRLYMARVPRFLPRPSLFRAGGRVSLSAPAFTRALLEAGVIPLAFVGAEAVEKAHQLGWIPTLLTLY